MKMPQCNLPVDWEVVPWGECLVAGSDSGLQSWEKRGAVSAAARASPHPSHLRLVIPNARRFDSRCTHCRGRLIDKAMGAALLQHEVKYQVPSMLSKAVFYRACRAVTGEM